MGYYRNNGEENMKKLSVFEKHQLKIARDTLKMSNSMVGVMGGMTKEKACQIIKELEGKNGKTC